MIHEARARSAGMDPYTGAASYASGSLLASNSIFSTR